MRRDANVNAARPPDASEPVDACRTAHSKRYVIEFFTDFVADLEVSRQKRLERVLIRKGSRLRAQLKPYVVETVHGPVEVADLHFEDGTCTRTVPFACLAFAE